MEIGDLADKAQKIKRVISRIFGFKNFFWLEQRVKKEAKERFQGSFKDPLFCFGTLSLVLVAAFFLVSHHSLSVKNLTASLRSGFENSEKAYVEPSETIKESPDFCLVQENSLMGSTPPIIVTPQVLGAIIGGIDLETAAKKEVREYRVEEGESLWSIAKKFDITLETLCWANDLNKNSIIRSGQKLIILPVSGLMHVVKDGDTLSRIAEVYKGETEEIIDFNGLSEKGEIYIGDILIIPGGEMPATSQIFSVPLASSYFIFPCQGKVTQGLHWYNAIDVANNCGTPIFAVAEGTVQRTGWTEIGGNFVRIIHPNGVVTYYGHLSKISAIPGQKVSQGAVIGYMGRTGNATGCHVHFDVRGAKNPLAKYPVGSYLSWD